MKSTSAKPRGRFRPCRAWVGTSIRRFLTPEGLLSGRFRDGEKPSGPHLAIKGSYLPRVEKKGVAVRPEPVRQKYRLVENHPVRPTMVAWVERKLAAHGGRQDKNGVWLLKPDAVAWCQARCPDFSLVHA